MRLHGSARSEPLQVIENHAIARSDTAANDAAAAELWAEFDGAIFGLVAVANNEHKAFALIVADRAFRDQKRVIERAVAHAHRYEHAGNQAAVFVVEAGPCADRSRTGVDPAVETFH